MNRPLRVFVSLLSAVSLSYGCNPGPSHSSSVSTTSVPHTEVKNQSVGNCWAYAVLAWAESLHLKGTGNEINMSESYLTYWLMYDKLMKNTWSKDVGLSGTWGKAKSLILEHGYLLEEEFIPSGRSITDPEFEKKAQDHVNAQMKSGGKLHGLGARSSKNIIAVLNEAFGVDGEEAKKRARKASDLKVAGSKGSLVSLAHAFGKIGKDEEWKQVIFMQPAGLGKSHREKTLKRVMKALNDNMPVVMALMVDFAALDRTHSTFRGDLLKTIKPEADNQGAHMVVLDDYTVDQVPGIGEIGEGEVSDEKKQLALEGRLRTLKAKNSWGINQNSLVPDGYTRFEIDYLTSNHKWTIGGLTLPYTALISVILPPGY